MSKQPPLTALALGCVLAATTTAAGSQTLSPGPRLGLWETQASVLINGRDVMAGLRQVPEEMMKRMPPAQRQQMAALMASKGGPLAGGKTLQCLAATDVARITKPEDAMAELQRNAPKCRFDHPVVKGSSVDFKGRCDDPAGFSGDVDGSFSMDSPTAWHGRFGGKGKMAGAEQIPGPQGGPKGQVEMQMQTDSKWISADCSAVKPLSATR
ncbi:MAG: DUF3617 domain-containing protein [Rubrivivax sp.]